MTKKHKHSKSFGSTIQLLATWGKVGDESESGGLGLKFGAFAIHFQAGVGQVLVCPATGNLAPST